jgi:D-Tyr-tRNAtyr deacylase
MGHFDTAAVAAATKTVIARSEATPKPKANKDVVPLGFPKVETPAKVDASILESIQASVLSAADTAKSAVENTAANFLGDIFGGIEDLATASKGSLEGLQKAVVEKTLDFAAANPAAAKEVFKVASALMVASQFTLAAAEEGGLRVLSDSADGSGSGAPVEDGSGSGEPEGMCITGRGTCSDTENDVIFVIVAVMALMCCCCGVVACRDIWR